MRRSGKDFLPADLLSIPRTLRHGSSEGEPISAVESRCRYHPLTAALLLAVVTLATFRAAAAESPVAPSGKAGGGWTIQWQPASLVNGAPVVFQIAPPARLSGLSAKWMQHDLSLTRGQADGPAIQARLTIIVIEGFWHDNVQPDLGGPVVPQVFDDLRQFRTRGSHRLG